MAGRTTRDIGKQGAVLGFFGANGEKPPVVRRGFGGLCYPCFVHRRGLERTGGW